jgi:hypothetical protein
MAYLTNREFAELEFRRQKRNEYTDALVKEVRRLREELTASQCRAQDARNELCQKCGRYHEAHKGACDGCRWKE